VQALAEQIEYVGSRADAIITDLGEATRHAPSSSRPATASDALVNNAGVIRLGPIDGAATDQWREVIHTNVMGLLYCTRAALPIMQAQGPGHIVNVSSMSGRHARTRTGVYT
jgi:NADP-dependent 3-hydroxy acid dehydrogenase YdfG